MKQLIRVNNVKCEGCINNIIKKLSAIDGVAEIAVDLATGTVTFDADQSLIETVTSALSSIGYPVNDAQV